MSTRRERMTEAQRRYEKTDKGKAARRKQNAKRVSMFGTRICAPDGEFKQFAIALRKERKNGHTEI